jgi:hypothetical protein
MSHSTGVGGNRVTDSVALPHAALPWPLTSRVGRRSEIEERTRISTGAGRAPKPRRHDDHV